MKIPLILKIAAAAALALAGAACVALVMIHQKPQAKPAPEPPAEQAAEASAVRLFRQADELAEKDRLAQAFAIYDKIAQDLPDTVTGKAAATRLNEMGLGAYFKSLDEKNSEFYVVQSGDNLTKIGRRYGVTPGAIAAANDLRGDLIRPGMKLKIMKEPWSLLISKEHNMLFLKAGSRVVKRYAVATGEGGNTPVGDFTIVNHLENPAWYYEGRKVAPDDPENPLGSRWMGFNKEGYGLHGTSDPDSIGQQVTLGCVRMHNSDIEELFGLLPDGAAVKIVE